MSLFSSAITSIRSHGANHALRRWLRLRQDVILNRHIDANGQQTSAYGKMESLILFCLDFIYAFVHLPAIRFLQHRGLGSSIHRLQPDMWKTSDTVFILKKA